MLTDQLIEIREPACGSPGWAGADRLDVARQFFGGGPVIDSDSIDTGVRPVIRRGGDANSEPAFPGAGFNQPGVAGYGVQLAVLSRKDKQVGGAQKIETDFGALVVLIFTSITDPFRFRRAQTQGREQGFACCHQRIAVGDIAVLA